MLSTAADMLTFLQAQLCPDGTSLEAAIRSAQRPRLRVDGGLERWVGLAWLIDNRPEGAIHWHNGGTYGFSAYAAFRPFGGVVLLANRRPGGDRTLERLGEAFLGSAVE